MRLFIFSELESGIAVNEIIFLIIYMFCDRFIHKMININKEVVREILPHLRQQIGAVEELRGAGADAKLR